MNKDKALELALEELENCADLLKMFDAPIDSCVGLTMLQAEKAITAIKQALLTATPLAAPYATSPLVQEPVASEAYDMIDRFLRNNLSSDDDYAEYSAALDVIYTTPPAQPAPVPLTDEQAHQILLDMAKHIETFGPEDITEQQLSAECVRFICQRVAAHGITKGQPILEQALAAPTSAEYAMGYAEGFNDGCKPAPVQEPVAQAWAEGYRAGIADERTSEANIGVAGMGMKVEPARNNPYRTTPPAAQRQWVGLTDESVVSAAARVLSDRVAASCNVDCGDMWMLHGNDSIDDARAMLEAAEAKLKENA